MARVYLYDGKFGENKRVFNTCVFDFENAVAGDYSIVSRINGTFPTTGEPYKCIVISVPVQGIDKLHGYTTDSTSKENLIPPAQIISDASSSVSMNFNSSYTPITIGTRPGDWDLRWRDKYYTKGSITRGGCEYIYPVPADETWNENTQYYSCTDTNYRACANYYSDSYLYFGITRAFNAQAHLSVPGIASQVQMGGRGSWDTRPSGSSPFFFKCPGISGTVIGSSGITGNPWYWTDTDLESENGNPVPSPYTSNWLYQMISFTYDEEDYIGTVVINIGIDGIPQSAYIWALSSLCWKGENGGGWDGPISEPAGGDGEFEDESDVIRKRGVNGDMAASLSGGAYNLYSLNSAEISQFFSAAFQTSLFDSFSDRMQAVTQGTIDCYMLPWGPGEVGSAEQIRLCGESLENTSAKRLRQSQNWINFGVLTIPRYYDTFLDYGPYTSMSIFLPFVGTFELPVNEFIGGSIQCYYIIDNITGDCTAFVECLNQFGDNHLVGQFHGNCKYEIPIAAGQRNNSGLIAATGAAAAISLGAAKGAATGAAAGPWGAVGGGLLGGLAGGVAAAPALIKAAQEPPVNAQVIGKMGGSQGWTGFEFPYIITTRQIYNQPETFGTDKGYTSNVSAKIQDLTGFNIVSNFNLDGITNATEEERSEIAKILQSGFYV